MRRHLTIISWLLAALFIVVAGRGVVQRFGSASSNRQLYPERFTDRLDGAASLEYEFTARHAALAGLWVFLDPGPEASVQQRLKLSARRAGDDEPLWSREFVLDKRHTVFGGTLLTIDRLRFVKGNRYLLTFTIPDAEPGRGWGLMVCAGGEQASIVRWTDHVQAGAEPGMLWLESRPRFPRGPLLLAVVLLTGWTLLARTHTRLMAPAWAVLAASCALIAAYGWQLRLWHFYGAFWPDGYPWISLKLHALLNGDVQVNGALGEIARQRSSVVFLVPLLMALVQLTGLSIKASYLVINGLLFLGAIALLAALVRLIGIRDDRSAIAIGLLFFSHMCVIHSVGALQTDLGGITFTMLFTYCFLRAQHSPEGRGQVGWLVACGLAGFFGALTRLGLLPLLLVPVGVFVWSLLFDRGRSWQMRTLYLVPTVVGGVLVLACWSGFDLWGALGKTREYAARPEFRSQFTWSAFARCSWWGIQLGLLAVLLLGRRLLMDRELIFTVGLLFSLSALLAVGHVVPWLRYWSPLAAVGVIICAWVPKLWPRAAPWFLGAGWIGVALNAYLAWSDPFFAF